MLQCYISHFRFLYSLWCQHNFWSFDFSGVIVLFTVISDHLDVVVFNIVFILRLCELLFFWPVNGNFRISLFVVDWNFWIPLFLVNWNFWISLFMVNWNFWISLFLVNWNFWIPLFMVNWNFWLSLFLINWSLYLSGPVSSGCW